MSPGMMVALGVAGVSVIGIWVLSRRTPHVVDDDWTPPPDEEIDPMAPGEDAPEAGIIERIRAKQIISEQGPQAPVLPTQRFLSMPVTGPGFEPEPEIPAAPEPPPDVAEPEFLFTPASPPGFPVARAPVEPAPRIESRIEPEPRIELEARIAPEARIEPEPQEPEVRDDLIYSPPVSPEPVDDAPALASVPPPPAAPPVRPLVFSGVPVSEPPPVPASAPDPAPLPVPDPLPPVAPVFAPPRAPTAAPLSMPPPAPPVVPRPAPAMPRVVAPLRPKGPPAPPVRFAGLVRGDSSKHSDGRQRRYITVKKKDAAGFPWREGGRVPVDLEVNGKVYSAGVRSTKSQSVVYIAADLHGPTGENITLAAVLEAANLKRGEPVVIEVERENHLRLLPGRT